MPLTLHALTTRADLMEILVAMALTILQIFIYIIDAMFILGVIGALLAIIGIARLKYNAWRNEKAITDTSTDEDDFEESYARDPGKRLITSAQSERMWREMDKLNDAAILENTKEL